MAMFILFLTVKISSQTVKITLKNETSVETTSCVFIHYAQ